MTTELVTVEGALTPAEFDQGLKDAGVKAKALTKIVERQKLYTQIGQGKHLRVEAWQTIAMGYGLTVGVDSTEILYQNGLEVGAKARVVVYDRQGAVRGGAEAYCMCNEGDWANRNTNQRISMAGTRATSKALRLLLSWVVVLAGYEPTPAEEMARDIVIDDLGACPKHNVPWRENKNGSLYHRTENDGWCNPSKEGGKLQPDAQDPPEQAQDDAWEEVAADVGFAGMTKKEFESTVLHCTWDDFLKRGGAGAEMALTLLTKFEEQQE